MSQKFPTDEFDFVGGVGGRFRARRGKRERFFEFAQVVLLGVVLSGGGYLGLQVVANSGNLAIDNGVVSNTVSKQFTKGGGVGVSVIDASNATDAASKLGQKLLDDGWNVWSASRSINNARKPGHVKKTVVYASGDSSAAAAKSLAKTLGDYPSVVSTDYSDPITIVLGTDYNN
jgi:hypothetical protein